LPFWGDAIPKFIPRHIIKKGRKRQAPYTWDMNPKSWAKEKNISKMAEEWQIM
jgi:hypothetical protein